MNAQLNTTPKQQIMTFTLPEYVEILERNMNSKQERLFLEALHFIQEHNSVNEHIHFPIYLQQHPWGQAANKNS